MTRNLDFSGPLTKDSAMLGPRPDRHVAGRTSLDWASQGSVARVEVGAQHRVLSVVRASQERASGLQGKKQDQGVGGSGKELLLSSE